MGIIFSMFQLYFSETSQLGCSNFEPGITNRHAGLFAIDFFHWHHHLSSAGSITGSMADAMDPAVSCALPKDLLELVFEHLPMPEIFRLQRLSKKWKQTSVTEPGSAFRQACAANSPYLFAIVSEGRTSRA